MAMHTLPSDLRKALRNDEASLERLRATIRKLRAGERVENWRLDVAESSVSSLEQVIENKRALLRDTR